MILKRTFFIAYTAIDTFHVPFWIAQFSFHFSLWALTAAEEAVSPQQQQQTQLLPLREHLSTADSKRQSGAAESHDEVVVIEPNKAVLLPSAMEASGGENRCSPTTLSVKKPFPPGGSSWSDAIIVQDNDDLPKGTSLDSASSNATGARESPHPWALREELIRDMLDAFCSDPHFETTRIDRQGNESTEKITSPDQTRARSPSNMEAVLRGRCGGDRAVLSAEQATALEAGLLAAACLQAYLLEVEVKLPQETTDKQKGMHSGCVCSTGNSIFTGHVNPSSTTSSAVKIKSQAHDLDSPKSAAVVCEPGDDLSRRMSEEINPGSLEHLLQLDPGWGLCSMIWHGVDPLERSRRSGRSIVNDSVRKGGLHLTFEAHANPCVVSFLYCCINLLVLFLLISHDLDFFFSKSLYTISGTPKASNSYGLFYLHRFSDRHVGQCTIVLHLTCRFDLLPENCSEAKRTKTHFVIFCLNDLR